MEQRSQVTKLKNERVHFYHEKLRNQVFLHWHSKSVIRLDQLESFLPKSRLSLYAVLDFDSQNDPDHRYLDDALSHLNARRYLPLSKLKDSIQKEMPKLNGMVRKLSAWETEMLDNLQRSTGLRAIEGQLHATPHLETFVIQTLFFFLDNSTNQKVQTNLLPLRKIEFAHGEPVSEFELTANVGNLITTIARSNYESKLERFKELIEHFPLEYASRLEEIKHVSTEIESNLTKFKTGLLALISDIDEYTFDGKCSYEERLRL